MNFLPPNLHFACTSQGPGRDIERMLNRLLGCHVDMQARLFTYYQMLLVGAMLLRARKPEQMRITSDSRHTFTLPPAHEPLMQAQEAQVQDAKRTGSYHEEGIITPSCASIVLRDSKVGCHCLCGFTW